MTVSVQDPENGYIGDGIQDTFGWTFKIIETTDLIVTVDDVLQTEAVEYSIVPGFTDAGGEIVFIFDEIPVNGAVVTLVRDTPQDQETVYTPFDPFPAKSHEGALDKLTMIVQELNRRLELLEP